MTVACGIERCGTERGMCGIKRGMCGTKGVFVCRIESNCFCFAETETRNKTGVHLTLQVKTRRDCRFELISSFEAKGIAQIPAVGICTQKLLLTLEQCRAIKAPLHPVAANRMMRMRLSVDKP